MEAMYHKHTAMNFFTLFATSVANLILVTGRRFAVKSAIGIYGKLDRHKPDGFCRFHL